MGRKQKLGQQVKKKVQQMACLHSWQRVVPRNELEEKLSGSGHDVWVCGLCDHREFRRPDNPPWYPIRHTRKGKGK